MKKSLAILGLLMAFSQPVFAQCGTCNPCNTCLPANPCNTCVKIVPIAKTCVQTCVPACNPCNPCATGAAVPIAVSAFAVDPEYEYCCQKKEGFWRRFFSF
jgi:hypothetical protein